MERRHARHVSSAAYSSAGGACIDLFLRGPMRPRSDQEIGKKDGKPIKRRRIIPVGRLRIAKVYSEHAPKVARAADNGRGMRSGHIRGAHDSKLPRAHEKIARGHIVHDDPHSPLQRGGACDQLSRSISKHCLKSPGWRRSSSNCFHRRDDEESPCQQRPLRLRHPGPCAEVRSSPDRSARPGTSARDATIWLEGWSFCRQPRLCLRPGSFRRGTPTDPSYARNKECHTASIVRLQDIS